MAMEAPTAMSITANAASAPAITPGGMVASSRPVTAATAGTVVTTLAAAAPATTRPQGRGRGKTVATTSPVSSP